MKHGNQVRELYLNKVLQVLTLVLLSFTWSMSRFFGFVLNVARFGFTRFFNSRKKLIAAESLSFLAEERLLCDTNKLIEQ